MDQGPQAPPVHRPIVATAHQNLRGHVLNGATEGVGDSALVNRLLTESKVRQFDVALAVEHDVLRFEVPVDDALGVEVTEGQCDLCQVETGRVFQEDALSLKMCEELATCLTELPWGFNSIQQTSTDAYSVPGPVLGEAGDTEMKRPSHCPQDAQSLRHSRMR